ncbi:MAG: hypothetical protein H0X25_13755 [Acidobacteriales bacterium]|nr:hypothetical protein [Terriglobales bacterium]
MPVLIAEYESYQDEMYGEGHGFGVHRFLEEHSSAERAAWRHQLEYPRDGEVRVGSGAAVSLLPLMVWCLVDTSFFVHSLLALSGEKQVCWELEQMLERHAEAIRLDTLIPPPRAEVGLSQDPLPPRRSVRASSFSASTVH